MDSGIWAALRHSLETEAPETDFSDSCGIVDAILNADDTPTELEIPECT